MLSIDTNSTFQLSDRIWFLLGSISTVPFASWRKKKQYLIERFLPLWWLHILFHSKLFDDVTMLKRNVSHSFCDSSLGSSGSFFLLFLNWFVSSIGIFSRMHSGFFISCFLFILCESGIFIISEWIFLKIHLRLKVWKDHVCGVAERIFKSSL